MNHFNDWRQLKPPIVKRWHSHIDDIIETHNLLITNQYSVRVPLRKKLEFRPTGVKIFAIGNSFVVKSFPDVRGKSYRNFINECLVGAAVSRKAGCRAYAFRVDDDGTGYIIMDHAAQGKALTTTMTLTSYLQNYQPKGPLLENEIFKTLRLFYASTKAMHGDLHFDNIMVNMKKDRIESVRIIDYGNVVYVPGLAKSKTLTDALKKISVFFQTKSGQSERQKLAAGEFNVKFNNRNGSALRDNKDVLDKWWAHLSTTIHSRHS